MKRVLPLLLALIAPALTANASDLGGETIESLLSDEEMSEADVSIYELEWLVPGSVEREPCPSGLNCVSVPTIGAGAPVYNKKGKRCKWYPDSFENQCTPVVTGICPVWVDVPNGYNCRNVRLLKVVCETCGEDDPDFRDPGNIKKPSDYMPTREEILDYIDLSKIYLELGYRDQAWILAQFAAEKVALKAGFLGSKTKIIVLRKMPSTTAGTIDPIKDIVYLGGSAFSSPEYLLSVIGHEFRHIQNRKLRRSWPYKALTFNEFNDYDEWDAYSWEFEHADTTGISDEERAGVLRRAWMHYNEFMSTAENKVKPPRYRQFLPWEEILPNQCVAPWGCNTPSEPAPPRMCSAPSGTGGKPIIFPCPK